MAKRNMTENTMAKRKMTDNTMAKTKMTENTMAKRKMTDNTMAKRKRTTGQTTIYKTLRCSVRLYLQLFVGERRSYLRCLYIFLYMFPYNSVQRILCCVFPLFFFVLCTQCCQFVWIVLFNCPFGIL